MLGLDSAPPASSAATSRSPRNIFESIIDAGASFLGVNPQEPPFSLSNHIVQLSTGEGKSIILGICSTVMALLGYKVDCACYSEHLSERDFRAFEPFFDKFGLSGCIHYGTFNRICESFLNKSGNIRESIASTLQTNPQELVIRGRDGINEDKPRLIIIDEVDVFFSPSFYGKSYNPKTLLKGSDVYKLSSWIWSYCRTATGDRNSQQFMASMRSRDEYAELCGPQGKYFCWGNVVNESLYAMYKAFTTNMGQNSGNHEYEIISDVLVYEVGEVKTTDFLSGYNTLYAYFYEFERGNISQGSLEMNCYILINSGSFSYSEIPKYYSNILGVTGTLKSLSPSEKTILQDYFMIRNFSFIPSAFGKNCAHFTADGPHSDVKIEDESTYFAAIEREIHQRKKSVIPGGSDRAVLVFFKTEQQLKRFSEYSQLEPSVMVPSMSPLERETKTKLAATCGTVTFATRHFGRGIDFVSHDEDLNNSGGAHVIQTFLSETESEEVQIKGRTARQGKNGSYSMVLLDSTLAAFGITPEVIKDMQSTNTYGSELYVMRNEAFEAAYPDTSKFVKELKIYHDQTLQMFNRFFSGDLEAFHESLFTMNRSSRGSIMSRTICMIDATGSMSATLAKTKTTVQSMFKLAYQVMANQGVESSFQMQFVLFRNYSSLEKILEYSSWESEPQVLCDWLNEHAVVQGGQGNEAIEIAFQHANRQEGVTQIILIGDAPPNTPEEVSARRGSSSFWASSPDYLTSTHYEPELMQLVSKGIPVSCFYVNNCVPTITAFQDMSITSGGDHGPLDINSPAGCTKLKELVTKKVIHDIGTRDASIGIAKRDAMLLEIEAIINDGFA